MANNTRRMKELNMGLLKPNPTLKPVTSLAALIPSSETFDPDGLFSTEIFGQVGTPERNVRESYVHLHTPVIQPMVYKLLITSRAFFGDIMAGKRYALWDKKLKTFVESEDADAETGYSFFTSHIDELILPETGSTLRRYVRALMSKYGASGKSETYLLTNRYLVIPAGIRDYRVDPATGRGKQDPINDLYRSLISKAGIIPGQNNTDSSVDAVAYNLQLTVVEIYEYLAAIAFGKKKVINAKLLSRKVFASVLNVLTASVDHKNHYFAPSLGTNESYIGLAHFCTKNMMSLPYLFKTGLIGESLIDKLSTHQMINVKTKELETVENDPKLYDGFITSKGISSLLKKLQSSDLKKDPFIYSPPGSTKQFTIGMKVQTKDGILIVQDPSVLSKEVRAKLVPLSLAELVYINVIPVQDRVRGISTRYPALNEGSSYPLKDILKTTNKTKEMRILDNDLKVTDIQYDRYPILETGFFDSISLASSHHGALGADHDGDKVTSIPVQTDEGIADIKHMLNKASYYKSPVAGVMNYTYESVPTELLIKSMN